MILYSRTGVKCLTQDSCRKGEGSHVYNSHIAYVECDQELSAEDVKQDLSLESEADAIVFEYKIIKVRQVTE